MYEITASSIGSSFFEHPLCKEFDIKNRVVTEPRRKRRSSQRRRPSLCAKDTAANVLNDRTLPIGYTFFEHPLCKELGIETLVNTEPRRKRRSLQRRCAINMLETSYNPPEEREKEKLKSQEEPEMTKNQPFHPRKLLSRWFRQHPKMRKNDSSNDSSGHSDNTAKEAFGRHLANAHDINTIEVFPSSHPSNWQEIPATVDVCRCIPIDASAHSRRSLNAQEKRQPPSRRSFLIHLGRSGSCLRNKLQQLGMDTDEQEHDSADNVLSHIMKEMEDQNIWNTFREREYK